MQLGHDGCHVLAFDRKRLAAADRMDGACATCLSSNYIAHGPWGVYASALASPPDDYFGIQVKAKSGDYGQFSKEAETNSASSRLRVWWHLVGLENYGGAREKPVHALLADHRAF